MIFGSDEKSRVSKHLEQACNISSAEKKHSFEQDEYVARLFPGKTLVLLRTGFREKEGGGQFNFALDLDKHWREEEGGQRRRGNKYVWREGERERGRGRDVDSRNGHSQ